MKTRAPNSNRWALHADVTGRRLREDLLRTVRLSSLEQCHQRMMQELVLRMARRLASTHSRRRKVFRYGQFHVPWTLRRNMKYDDMIFDLHWEIREDRSPANFRDVRRQRLGGRSRPLHAGLIASRVSTRQRAPQP